ncbi:unnamed protein product, partial [Vitis vinifera]|uniref:Uncharacterized protein n=1 Tax=Vitis vinifera TaxID=29760 RepID=E0CSA3_VITVI
MNVKCKREGRKKERKKGKIELLFIFPPLFFSLPLHLLFHETGFVSASPSIFYVFLSDFLTLSFLLFFFSTLLSFQFSFTPL